MSEMQPARELSTTDSRCRCVLGTTIGDRCKSETHDGPFCLDCADRHPSSREVARLDFNGEIIMEPREPRVST